MATNRQPQRNSGDLPDSPRDEERLKPDQGTIDLPEVHDIPGQTHIKPAPLGELADTTISSADEEGEGLFDDDSAEIPESMQLNQEDRKKDDTLGNP